MKPSKNIQLLLLIIFVFTCLSSCTNTEYGEGTPGKLVWRTSTGDEVDSSPAVVDGKVYVGAGDRNVVFPKAHHGSINCIDAETGQFVWRKIYSYELGNGGYVWSSPAVESGRLYLYDGVYDAETGEMLWSKAIQTPAVANGYVYYPSSAGITCLDDNGTKIWETSYEYSGKWSVPAVYNGKVYARNGNGKVVCFDGITGNIVWETAVQDDRSSSLSISNGLVYFISSDEEAVKCLDAETGNSEWNATIEKRPDSKPAVKGGDVYIAQSDRLYCFNALDGTKFWESSYEDLISLNSEPALTEKYIYIGAGNLLLCLNRQTGEKVWSYETEDYVDSSPAVVDGKVYFGSDDGWLYCVKAPADEDGYWPMLGYNPARTGSADEE